MAAIALASNGSLRIRAASLRWAIKKMMRKAAYVKKVVAGGMEVEPEVVAGSMDIKAKLLAVIGAELVGRASASGRWIRSMRSW